MASFTANPAAGMVFLPGYGRVRPGEVLMGEQWRQFAPRLLVEVPDPIPEQPMEVRLTPPKRVPLEVPKPQQEVPLEAREAPTSPIQRVLTEEMLEDKPKDLKKMVRRKR